MTKSYNPVSRWQWAWMSIPFVVVLLVLALSARAQQGSQGNTTIFGGAQMTFFGNHNFLTGGGGTQPGVIGTVRTAPFGVLNFAPSAATTTGGNDANHVDGYVRKYGTDQFIFPTGDNAHYGPFAAAADGTMGAYFFVDPTSAVTSNLAGGNYTPLPTGGPFPSATKEASLTAVSTKEYWDIDGANATRLTLTWSSPSDVAGLTSSTLSRLTIAGWNGTQWVRIPSTVDATSVLGGGSALTAGSITSTATLTPNTYTVYTLASYVVLPVPDLTPTIYARPSPVYNTSPITVVVDVSELLNVDTRGLITVKVSKDDLTSLSFASGTTTLDARAVQNSLWSFDGSSDPNYYILTTNSVVSASGKLTFGLSGTLTPGGTNGTLAISAVIVGGSGSETRVNNNVSVNKIDYFQK